MQAWNPYEISVNRYNLVLVTWNTKKLNIIPNVNYNFRNIFVQHQPVLLISLLNVLCFSASNKINVAEAIRCPNKQNTPLHRPKNIKFGTFLGGGGGRKSNFNTTVFVFKPHSNRRRSAVYNKKTKVLLTNHP